MADKNTIKNWFKTGLKPTQAQFWALFDSYRHNDEKIPITAIDDIENILAEKADAEVLVNHLTNETAHADLFDAKEDKSKRGVALGYAPLNEFTKLAIDYLNVVNDLVTGGESSLLTAEQGKLLQTQINNINVLLASDNVNMDNVQELVDAIETVQTSLSTILVNDLTTGGTTKALTAEMGKTLKGLIDGLETSKLSIADLSQDIETDKASATKVSSTKQVYDWALGKFKKTGNGIFFKGKDIYFFGDSYTYGTGASISDNRWTSIVSRALGANEFNQGVSGATLMKRPPVDYMASPNMVDNVVNIPTKTTNKAMLVFAFGLNDMGQTAPDYTTENYKTDYQTVLNNAFGKGWLPSQILIIPAYYIGTAGYSAYATITGNAAPDISRHLAFVQAAKEISRTNETLYFDIFLDQKKNDITLLDPDNIHANDAGYAYIANDFLQHLDADKVFVKNNNTWDLQAGFVQLLNKGNRILNSLIYDTGARIGIGTIDPQAGLHLNSIVDTVDQRFTNSITGSTNLDGTTIGVDLNGDFVVNNYENKGIILATNNIIGGYFNSLRHLLLNTLTDNGKGDLLQVEGIIDCNGLRSIQTTSSANLNDFFTNTIAGTKRNDICVSATGAPDSGWFSVDSIRVDTGSEYGVQIATSMDTGKIYTRYNNSSVWSSWTEK